MSLILSYLKFESLFIIAESKVFFRYFASARDMAATDTKVLAGVLSIIYNKYKLDVVLSQFSSDTCI